MSKKVKQAEAPAPEELLPAQDFIVNFRRMDGAGRPMPHPWLPFTMLIGDCTSADEARKQVHQMVDEALYQIEPRKK
jgi:hypothetical protein